MSPSLPGLTNNPLVRGSSQVGRTQSPASTRSLQHTKIEVLYMFSVAHYTAPLLPGSLSLGAQQTRETPRSPNPSLEIISHFTLYTEIQSKLCTSTLYQSLLSLPDYSAGLGPAQRQTDPPQIHPPLHFTAPHCTALYRSALTLYTLYNIEKCTLHSQRVWTNRLNKSVIHYFQTLNIYYFFVFDPRRGDLGNFSSQFPKISPTE